jgi:hypothetical protein
VEVFLEEPDLPVAADERRLQPGGPQRSATGCDDALGAPQPNRLGLALEIVCPRVLVDDRGLGDLTRRVTHVDGAWLCNGLHARRGVDEVTRHHPFADRPNADRGLTGQHTRPRHQARRTDLLAQGGDGVDELQGGAHRPLGVVLLDRLDPPHGHHRVPDELLNGPPRSG